jgi:hypothetical protein
MNVLDLLPTWVWLLLAVPAVIAGWMICWVAFLLIYGKLVVGPIEKSRNPQLTGTLILGAVVLAIVFR